MSPALRLRMVLLDFAEKSPEHRDSCKEIVKLINEKEYDAAEERWFELLLDGDEWEDFQQRESEAVCDQFAAVRRLLTLRKDPSKDVNDRSTSRWLDARSSLFVVAGFCLVANVIFLLIAVSNRYSSWIIVLFSVLALFFMYALFWLRKTDADTAVYVLDRVVSRAIIRIIEALFR